MAWLEVADPFCKYLKNGKCAVDNEVIDNPNRKCFDPMLKCKKYRDETDAAEAVRKQYHYLKTDNTE